MARTGISAQDVATAAESLIDSGLRFEAITIERLRDALGTGSYSTISKHLRAWKANHLQRASSPPEGWPRLMAEQFDHLVSHARQEARSELAQQREDIEQQRLLCLEERDQALQAAQSRIEQINRLERKLEAVQQRLENSMGQCAQLEARCAQLGIQAQHHSEQIARSEAKHRQQLGVLEVALADTQERLRFQQTEASASRALSEKLLAQLDQQQLPGLSPTQLTEGLVPVLQETQMLQANIMELQARFRQFAEAAGSTQSTTLDQAGIEFTELVNHVKDGQCLLTELQAEQQTIRAFMEGARRQMEMLTAQITAMSEALQNIDGKPDQTSSEQPSD